MPLFLGGTSRCEGSTGSSDAGIRLTQLKANKLRRKRVITLLRLRAGVKTIAHPAFAGHSGDPQKGKEAVQIDHCTAVIS